MRLHRELALLAAAITLFVGAYFVATEADGALAVPSFSEPEPTPTAVEQFREVTKMVEEAQLTESAVQSFAESASHIRESEVETIQQEDERIEAALVEQGYYRDDIPLTYLEQDHLRTAAKEFGVDYFVMVALIERETNFKNTVGDDGNAFGYGQVWPKWWSGLMEEIGAEDLMDPRDNFQTACAIVASLTDDYGDIENALTYYNTGAPGESEYASDILANAKKWREA